ncbi:hypothetical protein [Flavivirga spongiicola]|uniref:Uncharacterized protein n=1 Tax=Flavivirga spongiicola TaxID=421621 RepID=A0ABU7XTE8_9FLAO|nr:hypothetical protein [Flavivirga sp. MEBiC05379]MDO5978841.1 hypothetical protein [Flavivirga sp. MEBiC05379]
MIALLLVAYIIMKDRTGGGLDIEKMDRFRFFLVFLDEIKSWNFINFLFGNERITSLSCESCEKLSWYKNSFSYKNDGSCYSVILHSYLLRVILDHGIVGLSVILLFLTRVLRYSGITLKDSFVVIGIVVINGLSVSSFNSVFFVMGLLFVIVTDTYMEKPNLLISTKNLN